MRQITQRGLVQILWRSWGEDVVCLGGSSRLRIKDLKSKTVSLRAQNNFTMLPSQIILFASNQVSHKLGADPLADLHLSLNKRVWSINRKLFAECRFLGEHCSSAKKIHLITEPLQEYMLQRVLEYYYGVDLCLQTRDQLMQLAQVLDFLEAESLLERLQEEICTKIQVHDIFYLLELAYRYSLKKIFQRCFEELYQEQFEQINYNKFDFVLCDFKLFQVVLKKHALLKEEGKIKGQSEQNIQDVIRLYCARYHYNEETCQQLFKKYAPLTPHKLKKDPETDRTQVDTIDGQFKNKLQGGKIAEDSSPAKRSLKRIQARQSEGNIKDKDNVQSLGLKLFRSASLKKRMIRRASFIQQSLQEQRKLEELYRHENDDNFTEPIPEQTQYYAAKQRKRKGSQENKISELAPKIRVIETTSNQVQRDRKTDGCHLSIKGLEDEDDPESYAGKISTLLSQYQQAYQQHENNFEALKKNAKSMIFKGQDKGEQHHYQENKASIFKNGKFTSSRGLERNLSNTLEIPDL